VLSAVEVSKRMDAAGLSEDLRNKILHMIVSHHGKKEYGSPKEPMFPEAVVLYYADELSSKTSEMIEFVKDARQDTEDDFMYHRRYGRNILLK
jgi:3'-5' exoribonuclease